jgi:chromosome segregation ATPase
MADDFRKPVSISRYGNANNSDSAVAEQQTIFVADAINIAELTNRPEVDRGENAEAAGELNMYDDGKMELLDAIGIMAEEKDNLDKELEQKSHELEAMREKVQQLKNELDRMHYERSELNNFFETEKSTLLDSHEDEKRRFHDLHQKEKIVLEETHRKQAETMGESYQQEKTALQESHEEEKRILRGLHEQEKETWRKDKLKETEKLEHVTAARDELQQEKVKVAEQLQNANLAKAAAEKQQHVLLDRLRDVARHAQCQPSDPTSNSGLRPGKKTGWMEKKIKKVQNKLSMSSSGASKTTTLEMLETDGLFQALTERIDQLAATESKICILDEQSADLRSQKDDLESKLSSLSIRNAELSDENESLQAEASEGYSQTRIRNQREELARLTAKAQRQQDEIDELQALYDMEQEEKCDLETKVDRQQADLSHLNSRIQELQCCPRAESTVIILCIDRSMTDGQNTVGEELMQAMLEKIKDESDDRTLLSLVTHGDSAATIQGGRNFHTITEMRQILVNLNMGFYIPSYSSALGQLIRVCDAAEDKAVSEIKVYLIGDGYSGEGGLEKNSGYEELEGRGVVKFWGFCLEVHPDTECCFSILDGKCHDHSSGFNSRCILPI